MYPKTPKNLANLAWLMYSKHCTVSATVRLNYITTMYYTTMYYYYPPDRKHVVNSLARLFKQYVSHPTTTACHRRALTANLRLFCCKYKCIMQYVLSFLLVYRTYLCNLLCIPSRCHLL